MYFNRFFFNRRFIAENAEAVRKSLQRNKSPKRSRSRSPRYGRKRSRSPADIGHIARRRVREQSPTYKKWATNGTLIEEPLRQNYPPYARIYPKKKKNGNRNNRIPDQIRRNSPANKSPNQDKSETKAEDVATVNSQNDHEKNGTGDDNKVEMDIVDKTVKEKQVVEKQSKREKTEQEIEDELLASTDEEDDGDQIKLTLDENELDFLDDDEEESEGRFKSSKPIAQTAKQPHPKQTYNKFSDKFNNKRNNRTYDTSRINNRRPKSPVYQRKPDHSFKNTFKDKPSSSINGSSSSNTLKDSKETNLKNLKAVVSTAPSLSFKPTGKDGEFVIESSSRC